MVTDKFYRPVWTCGKYNAKNRVAIMFNLLANSEFFFEGDSADVIDIVLKAGRNGRISYKVISDKLDISVSSLIPFFETLLECGLLSETLTDEAVVQEYRNKCADFGTETSYMGEKVSENTNNNIGTAELAYMAAVKKDVTIDSVMFELTYRCSEQCLHCYNPGASRNDNEVSTRGDCVELSTDDYKRIIDEMCDNGLVSANLSGGDPFSYKGIWKVLDYLYEKDIAVTIFTNGIYLCNNIDRILSYYPKEIKLSLYSSIPNIHDSITRLNGSWEKTIKTIKSLRGNAIPVTINCIIMRPAVKSYRGIQQIAELYGCNIGYDICVTDAIDGDMCATQNLRLTPEELEIILMDNNVMQMSAFNINDKLMPEENSPCRAGNLNYCVTPNGDLIPCCAFHLVFGNLKTDSFDSIIKESVELKKWQQTSYREYTECFLHDYCSCCTLCPGNNYIEYSNPFKPGENNCYIAKARYSVFVKKQKNIDVLQGRTVQECLNEFPEYKQIVLQKMGKRDPLNSPTIKYSKKCVQ